MSNERKGNEMKIYRLSCDDGMEGHEGYTYYPSRREAESAGREWVKTAKEEGSSQRSMSVNDIEFAPTKTGVLRMLNRCASYRNNG